MVPLVVLKCGTWYPFWKVTTSCWSQNTDRSLHIWRPAPYPYNVDRKLPQSTVSHALQSSRNTSKGFSWSTLANSCANIKSSIYFPVPLPAVYHGGHHGSLPLPSGRFQRLPPLPSTAILTGQPPSYLYPPWGSGIGFS